jgi:iron-sulfur cluster repair protein YtfE (RIC family)
MSTRKRIPTVSARTLSRHNAQARQTVVQMLTDDHQRMRQAFRAFAQKDIDADSETTLAIVRRTCAELEVHAILEEEVLYPAARDCRVPARRVDEAEVEHAAVQLLIDRLQRMTPHDPQFAACFTVLSEYVQHHLRQEEGEIFPRLNRGGLTDWESLLADFVERRAELRLAHGLAGEGARSAMPSAGHRTPAAAPPPALPSRPPQVLHRTGAEANAHPHARADRDRPGRGGGA